MPGEAVNLTRDVGHFVGDVDDTETSKSPVVVQRRKNSRRTNRKHYLL